MKNLSRIAAALLLSVSFNAFGANYGYYDANNVLRSTVIQYTYGGDHHYSGGDLSSGVSRLGADLSNADLHNASLFDANLDGANLSGAYLTSAEMEDISLEGADLTNAIMNVAYMKSADLADATFSGANLRFSNLYAANLSGADLTGADLYAANTTFTNFTGATYDDETFLPPWVNPESRGMIFVTSAPQPEEINVPAMGGIGLLALGLSMLGLGAVRLRKK